MQITIIDKIKFLWAVIKHWLHIYPEFSILFRTSGTTGLDTNYTQIPIDFSCIRVDLKAGSLNLFKLSNRLDSVNGIILNKYDYIRKFGEISNEDDYPEYRIVITHKSYPIFIFCGENNDEVIVIYHKCLLNSDTLKDFCNLILEQSEEYSPAPPPTPKVSLLSYQNHDFTTRSFEVKDFNDQIQHNYSKHVWEGVEFIKDALYNKTHGLILFSGVPGGGKTSLIRYLCSTLYKDFNVLLIQPEIAKNIGSVEFQNFLINLTSNSSKKYILVFEDAENLLSPDANGVRNSAVTNILNITDGIVGDILQVRIICTFNTDYSKIDSALTRKGRLIKHIEIDELDADVITEWCSINNIPIPKKDRMCLADLYAYKEECNNLQPEVV